MSNYKNQVLELVKQRPGVRVFQISDLLDLDVDIVESILAQAVREELIVVEQVMGPNKRLTNAYNYPGAMTQVLDKQEVKVTVKVPEGATETIKAALIPAAPAAPVATPVAKPAAVMEAEPVRPKIKPAEETAVSRKIRMEAASKASLALDYLKKHGATDRGTLVEVMGLSKKYQVEQFLKGYTNTGRLVRIEDIYCMPDHPAASATVVKKQTAPEPAPAPAPALAVSTAPVPAADPVHSPSHYTSGGIEVIDVLRAKLTPEEFRGFLKGNVIKYMLRAEHKGGAQDYKKGCVYATWLAEQSVAQAA